VLPIARGLVDLGFALVATRGTAAFLRSHGLHADAVFKVNEGRPNAADHMVNGLIHLVINTPLGRASFFDDRALRRTAMLHGIPCITTLTGAAAAVAAIRDLRQHVSEVRALQDYHAKRATGATDGRGGN
jgi:carbamoyl-phosphate synthase large subunit